jgi:hypothetical protein
MANENNDMFDRWMNIYKWRGEQVHAIKAINIELKEIKEELKYIRRCNTKRDVRVASISGTTALLVAIIVAVIANGIF